MLDRYHPSVDDFLAHVAELRERSGWDASLRRARVERVRAVDGGFELDGHGVWRHVLLAPGHPGLHVPGELRDDPRAVHAYEPHEYAASVTVVGAGLAAATEWLNALEAGAEVVSVRRREPLRRPLNVPRAVSLAPRALGLPPARRGRARGGAPRAARAVVPARPALRRAAGARGRGGPVPRRAVGERDRAGDLRDGLPAGASSTTRCSRRLVAEHGLETAGSWIVLAPDSTVPALTDGTRTLALAGAPAQWAFPAADTLAGAKYAAHGFLRRILACRTR